MKFDWTQDQQSIQIDIHTHTVKTVQVQFNEQTLEVRINFKNRIPETETFAMQLSNPIVASECSHQVQGQKIKLILKKSKPVDWINLGQVTSRNVESKVRKPLDTSEWERLLRETDDQDDKIDPGDVLKQLYDSCDDNAKKAMIKSFTESNGTVLNMKWGEVGPHKVQPFDK